MRPSIFGRDDEIEEISRILSSGKHVFVEGLRRMGKTWTVQEYQQRLNSDKDSEGKFCFYVDVGSCKSHVEFFRRVIAKLDESKEGFDRWKAEADGWLGRIEEASFFDFTVKLANKSGDVAESFVGTLKKISADSECNITIILDEYPLMLWTARDNGAEHVVQAIKDVTDHNPNIRFIFTGSTGLQYSEAALRKKGVTISLTRECEELVIRGFHEHHLGAQFSESVAARHPNQTMLSLMAKDLPEIHDTIARECSAVPMWIETVWQKLGVLTDPFSAEDVSAIITRLLEQGDVFSLDQYEERLEGYEALFNLNPLKRPILDLICDHSAGMSREDLRAYIGESSEYTPENFKQALKELKQDHYLVEEDSNLSFSLELLRRYWKAQK